MASMNLPAKKVEGDVVAVMWNRKCRRTFPRHGQSSGERSCRHEDRRGAGTAKVAVWRFGKVRGGSRRARHAAPPLRPGSAEVPPVRTQTQVVRWYVSGVSVRRRKVAKRTERPGGRYARGGKKCHGTRANAK